MGWQEETDFIAFRDWWTRENQFKSDKELQKELKGIVMSLFMVLTEQEREIINMRFWKNYTFNEIARAIRKDENYVQKAYNDAIEKMRKLLTNENFKTILKQAGFRYAP